METRLIFPKFVLYLLLLGLIPACSSSPATAVTTGVNLAPNPSFEDAQGSGVSGWQGYDPVTSTWSGDIAYSGSHSVCLSNLAPQSSTGWETSELIPITPGATYTFSAYVKGDFDGEGYILVFPIDEGGNTMDGYAADASFNNTDWTYVEVVLGVPADAVAVRLDLGTNNPSDTATTGMICYDDVSFK